MGAYKLVASYFTVKSTDVAAMHVALWCFMCLSLFLLFVLVSAFVLTV